MRTFRYLRERIRSRRDVQLGPGKQRGKTCFGLRNRKKISQIINDYLYLTFLLLIILNCLSPYCWEVRCRGRRGSRTSAWGWGRGTASASSTPTSGRFDSPPPACEKVVFNSTTLHTGSGEKVNAKEVKNKTDQKLPYLTIKLNIYHVHFTVSSHKWIFHYVFFNRMNRHRSRFLCI